MAWVDNVNATLKLVIIFSVSIFDGVNSTTDAEALMTFKARITGDPYQVLAGWGLPFSDPCVWPYITCNDNNRVIKLELVNMKLFGTLAPELGSLDALQFLLLYQNNLVGPLPPELGKLQQLISLDLSENQLSGPIPLQFDNFEQPHNLKYLRLDNNYLDGTIPASLGIIDLEQLILSNNNFSGFLPSTFSRYDASSFYPGNRHLCGGTPIDKNCDGSH